YAQAQKKKEKGKDAAAPSEKKAKAIESAAALPAVLWREPTDIATRDLYYGQGGKEQAPQGKFTFVEEDPGGSNPKFEVKDESGQRWKVKLGEESQPETVASRLIWAVGYFTDEDYYLPEMRVEGMPKLKRGQSKVSSDGTVRGARLERHVKGQKTLGNWSWFDNPFNGTKELSGLKVMMGLINNWDLKEVNNKIYLEKDTERRYVVSDLGAAFGKTGNTSSRSKGDLEDYVKSKFIARVNAQSVDFDFHSRPSFLFRVKGDYYKERADMEKIMMNIPRADAKWIGSVLGQLSEKQISDAFRSAGYGPAEVSGYTRKVMERIAELNKL